MIEVTKENFGSFHGNDDVFAETKLAADSGFHTNDNMKILAQKEIDAYIADRGGAPPVPTGRRVALIT